MSEQEPVAWKVIDKTNGEFMFSRVKPMERNYKFDVVIPLYTSPPTREPLSDEEVLKIAIKIAGDIGIEHDPTDFEGTGIFELARAIEQHHGIGGGE